MKNNGNESGHQPGLFPNLELEKQPPRSKEMIRRRKISLSLSARHLRTRLKQLREQDVDPCRIEQIEEAQEEGQATHMDLDEARRIEERLPEYEKLMGEIRKRRLKMRQTLNILYDKDPRAAKVYESKVEDVM
ncbi:hypothetical protein JXA05_01615 [Candidatus Peregrinibacteria bacterium]|nr:hypothetical protein [Candidatus Peregrinibacteria bacterium]